MGDVNLNVALVGNVGIFNTLNHYDIRLQETYKICSEPSE